jgi:hypothetical protein
MIWLSSPDLGVLPKLSSVVLLDFAIQVKFIKS